MTKASGSRPPLGDIDASAVTRLVETASDLALVLDHEGVIVDLVGREDELARRGRDEWLGRAWIDTVTAESRDKVAALLHDAAAGVAPTRWRQVNHPVPDGDDLPIVYSAVAIGAANPRKSGAPPRTVAVGRDLRATVALQRKLIEAQQAMERDYWRFREAETRYRNLLQTSSEAILVVELQTLKIVEANPAAEALCAGLRQRPAGAPLVALFDGSGEAALQAQLAAARTIGKRDPGRFTLADGTPVMLSLSSFRQDEAGFLLARLLPVAVPLVRGKAAKGAAAVLPQVSEGDALLRAFVGLAPDGIAFTDLHGRVLSVNRAFSALAELSTEDQARGQMLDRWLGRTGVELHVLIGNLRQRGSAGLFTTTLRGEFGATTEVEIAATVLPPGQGDALAFSVRDVARRLQANTDTRANEVRLPRTVGELNELVGRVPLKDIVSETTDVIEQMAIQTALRMTGDNRASAAQLLGLSRQSLYVKLRRFGIGELAEEEAPAAPSPG
jgi:transcriptional regulator PpsR